MSLNCLRTHVTLLHLPISLHLGSIWNLNSVSWSQVITLLPLNFLSSEQSTDTTVPKLTGKDMSVFRLAMSVGRSEHVSGCLIIMVLNYYNTTNLIDLLRM